jgi:hypothetical protein
MKRSPEIWNELMEISPLVAGIPLKEDLYSLPEGYFDKLAAHFLDLSRDFQSETVAVFLAEIKKNPYFPIPGNYFESFPDKLMSLIKSIQAPSVGEELGGLSPLLNQIDRKTPFSVPEGYFDGLSAHVAARLSSVSEIQEDSEMSSLVINSLEKNNVYEVPQGYFEALPQVILNKAKQRSGRSKVITLGKSRSIFKYAAAAVLAGAILIGGALFVDHHSITKAVADSANPGLATVSDQEILSYLEAQNVPLSDINSLAAVDLNESDAKDLLSDVSDEELQQYLNEHISPKDLKSN